jgi:regulator of protease activity HflC (stomatin/prohibitin superfamily)
MTSDIPQKITSAERKRLAAEQTNEVARLTAEAEKKARDEKTARLRAIRLAKMKDS